MIIDPVTNLLEIVRIENRTSEVTAQQFSNAWLSRYPWPVRCIHDGGSEFIGYSFQHLLQVTGITPKKTQPISPTANAIIERSHKTIGDTLRVLLHTAPPRNENDATRMVENALAACMHAMRCSVNHTMQASPGSIAFSRDMLINVPVMANLIAIRDRRQLLIDENLRRANKKRTKYSY